MSIVMTSGLSDSASATASRPSLALPTTWSCSSALKIPSRTLRINRESSTTSTRIFLLGVAIVCLPHRRDGARRLRSYELFDRRDQLILLDRLGQECRGAFLHRPITMLCPRAQWPSSPAQRFARRWRLPVSAGARLVLSPPCGSGRSKE